MQLTTLGRVLFFGIVGAVFFQCLHYEKQRVSLLRLERALRAAPPGEQSPASCGGYTTRSQKPVEALVARELPTIPGAAPCSIVVHEQQFTRFWLRTYSVYRIETESSDGRVLWQSLYRTEFPTPLCLVPFLVFFAILTFEIRGKGLRWLIVPSLLLIGGLNLVQAGELANRSLRLAIKNEPSALGFLLVLFWIAILRSRPSGQHGVREKKLSEAVANRVFTHTLGLWSPLLFTALGRAVLPMRARLFRIGPWFAAQALVAAFSVYLLALDGRPTWQSVLNNLLLPRYFTFAVIVLFLLQFWNQRPKSQVVLLRMKPIWCALFFVGLTSGLAHFIPAVAQFNGLFNSISRAGMALVAAEFIFSRDIQFNQIGKTFFPLAGALLVSLWFPSLALESGLADLVFVLSDPRLHPNSAVFFTFLSGLMVAFSTGSFSIAFFLFYSALGKNLTEQPLLHAALLDGLVAGCLLSPFSWFNLIPRTEFRWDLAKVISLRFRQLGFAILAALLIYTVSMIHTVAILRPIVFVFLVMCAAALQLRRNSWIFTRVRTNP